LQIIENNNEILKIILSFSGANTSSFFV